MQDHSEYKHAELTHAIIGACMEVHTILGNGFQEVMYQRALSIEMKIRGIEHSREHEMEVYYKEHHIGDRRVDFFVEGKVMVELKAVSEMTNDHLAQGLNYLEAYNLEVGLLINFGTRSLQYKRLLNKKYKPNPSGTNESGPS
ncbi:MAG: GxxExxY protein [Chitinophagaceae bacterium]|jgi:GxxExxY protein|nr:GxxExxY protein [Chitinophagaceae bacterium]